MAVLSLWLITVWKFNTGMNQMSSKWQPPMYAILREVNAGLARLVTVRQIYDPSIGRMTVTRVPSPGADWMEAVPPTARARSCIPTMP